MSGRERGGAGSNPMGRLMDKLKRSVSEQVSYPRCNGQSDCKKKIHLCNMESVGYFYLGGAQPIDGCVRMFVLCANLLWRMRDRYF